jgi:hypothetical protein
LNGRLNGIFTVKHNSDFWLVALFVSLLLGFSSTVRAQTLAVTLSSSGTQTLSAGDGFSNGGEITVTASGVSGTITLSSITISVSNPAVFDSLTLNASTSGGASESDDVPLNSGDNTITLSTISLSNGQTATFTLSGTASSTPAGTGGLVRYQFKNVRLASMFSPGPAGAVSMLLAGLTALVMLAASGRLRRRHLIAFAVWAVMAAAVAGCGNGGSSSSDQQAVSFAATASSGDTITANGLPVDMGTITIDNSGSSEIIGPTPSPT